jgi:peptidyl-prolyl cis-trans isomerase D
MLELIQQRFQTVVLVVLVFMLSAVFVLQFGGPQSQGCSSMFDNSGYAARVQGRTLTNGDFRAAYAVPGFNQYRIEQARTLRLRELTLDGLIERELLANAALEMGFRVADEEVMDDLLETGVIYLNPSVDAPPGFPGPEFDVSSAFEDRNGNFSARRMRGFISNALRRSTDEFVQWQVRERLAGLARDAIAEQVSVSPDEVRAVYVRDTERALLDYVQFRPSYYRDRIEPAVADVTTWMGAHQSEVDEEYTRQRHNYTGLELQVRARHVLIKAAQEAPEADRTAARARAEAILARVRGGEDFATVARAESEDEGSARRGGDLGFNPRGRMVAPFDEAQFATEVGQITDHIVESQFGFHVIKVEGRREGDVPEAEAKLEIAERLYVRARASELAREEAVRALAYLRDGHTTAELDAQLAQNWAPPAAPVDLAAAPGATTPPTEAAPPAPPERDALAPQVRETRRFGRTDTPISGAFDSGPLTRAAFEMSLESPLPEEPIQLGDDWFVYRLKERTEATDEGFTDEVRQRITDELLTVKRTEALRVYVHELREAAQDRGEIRIDDRILRYGDEQPEDQEDRDEGEPAEEESEPAQEESALPRVREAIPA